MKKKNPKIKPFILEEFKEKLKEYGIEDYTITKNRITINFKTK